MKDGQRPTHLIPWAPQDYLTSRTRMRAITTQDHLLRLVYREILDVLYAEGGSVALSALPDLVGLPKDEVERAVALCRDLGSVAVAEDGTVTNPRVTRTLAQIEDLRSRRADAGRRGGASGGLFGALGGRPRKPPQGGSDNPLKGDPETPLRGLENPPHNPIPSPSPITEDVSSLRDETYADGRARVVFDYWHRKSGTKVRSRKVEESVLVRIRARLKDGFDVDALQRCVDFSMADPFYVERGYYRQPDVIFRNAGRVQSILARIETARDRPLPL